MHVVLEGSRRYTFALKSVRDRRGQARGRSCMAVQRQKRTTTSWSPSLTYVLSHLAVRRVKEVCSYQLRMYQLRLGYLPSEILHVLELTDCNYRRPQPARPLLASLRPLSNLRDAVRSAACHRTSQVAVT
jgi:hypothetical protein